MQETQLNAQSNIDPPNGDSLAGAFMQFAKDIKKNTDDTLPAKIIAYDTKSNTAQIQVAIKTVSTTGEATDRAQHSEIPVFMYGGGGFVFRIPIIPGDTGWIKACDRDASLYMQSNGERNAIPNSGRMKDFSNGFFIPDALKKANINEEDRDSAVIQSNDGSVRIALSKDGSVKITAKKFEINAPEVTMRGALTVDGRVIATGGITASGTAFENHVHDGVQTGNDKTGKPA